MEDNYKKVLGTRLNTALANANMKQKDLAKLLDVKDNTISYFCGGKRIPTVEQLMKISRVLNVSVDYLLGLTDVTSTDKDIKAICDYTGLNEDALEFLEDTSSEYNLTLKEYNENLPLFSDGSIFIDLELAKAHKDAINYLLGTEVGQQFCLDLSWLLYTVREINSDRLFDLEEKQKIVENKIKLEFSEIDDIRSAYYSLKRDKLPLKLRAGKSDVKEQLDKLLNLVFIEKIDNEAEIKEKEIDTYEKIFELYKLTEAAENGND